MNQNPQRAVAEGGVQLYPSQDLHERINVDGKSSSKCAGVRYMENRFWNGFHV